MNNVKPMHDKFIHPMKRYADLILNTNKGSLEAAERISNLVSEKLQNAHLKNTRALS